MDLRTLRDKAIDSVFNAAVEMALKAMLLAIGGAVVSGVALMVALIAGFPEKWLYAVSGALVSFLLMIIFTLGIEWAKRRNAVSLPQGRMGLLNFLMDRDESMRGINESVSEIGKETEKIGTIIGRRASKQALYTNKGDINRSYEFSSKTAAKIGRRAGIMEIHAEALAHNTDVLAQSVSSWLQWLQTNKMKLDEENRAIFLSAFRGMRSAILGGTKSSMETFRDTMEHARTLSDSLDIAGGRLVGVINSVIKSMDHIVRLCNEVERKVLKP